MKQTWIGLPVLVLVTLLHGVSLANARKPSWSSSNWGLDASSSSERTTANEAKHASDSSIESQPRLFVDQSSIHGLGRHPKPPRPPPPTPPPPPPPPVIEVDFGSSSWDFLGPLPNPLRGSGDILSAFVGPSLLKYIEERNTDNDKFPSELADGGFATWKRATPNRSETTRAWYASVDFHELNVGLLESFYGIAGLEFFTILATEIVVPESGLYRFNGTSAPRLFYIGDKAYRHDPYMGSSSGFVYQLVAGRHTFWVPLADYGDGAGLAISPLLLVKSTEADPQLFIVGDTVLPDIVQGRLSSPIYSVTILLAETLVSATNSPLLVKSTFMPTKYGKPFVSETKFSHRIESFQPFPLKLALDLPDDLVIDQCGEEPQLHLELSLDSKILTTLDLHLRCLNYSDAYRFTFEDFDGSVQFAALWSPKAQVCPEQGCPVIFSFHGAGVEADSWAWTASYRRQQNAWVLLPTNRRQYGYDWETTGSKDGWSALNWLGKHLPGLPINLRGKVSADITRIVYAGHSMGGHGCLVAATHYPDFALAFVPAAGWLKHSLYLPSSVAPDFSHMDHVARGILENSIGESDADFVASNVVGIPALLRVGTIDDNVPSHNLRRFHRILASFAGRSAAQSELILSEIPGVGHWFDGVVNDDEIQAFFDRVLLQSSLVPARQAPEDPQAVPQCPPRPALPRLFSFTTLNPSVSGSRAGLRILQTVVTGRPARFHVEVAGSSVWFVRTENIALLNVSRQEGMPFPRILVINGITFPGDGGGLFAIDRQDEMKVARVSLAAPPDGEADWTIWERSPANYGPARQVFETGPVKIVFAAAYGEKAKLLAIDMFSRGRWAPILCPDTEFDAETDPEAFNLVLLGGPWENKAARWHTENVIAKFEERNIGAETRTLVHWNATAASFAVGPKTFAVATQGIIFVAPQSVRNPARLTLTIAGNSVAAFDHISRFIPNFAAARVPDYLVCDSSLSWQGYGSCSLGGYWDYRWSFSVASSFGG